MKKINNKSEFDNLRKCYDINIVKFGIEGCIPCAMVEEILKELEVNSKTNTGTSNVEYYVCENVDLMKELDIATLPVVYIISKEYEERIEAYSCIDELEEKITETINWHLATY